MSAAPAKQGVLPWGALATALAVVLQGIVLARLYPAAYLDADLLSYLAYYRDLVAGAPVPFGYTVPKLLPIVLFGPLKSPELALALSIGVAAVGGALVFLVAARAFGTWAAVLAAVAYVADPLRSVLTLRSSVDLDIGVALLAAVLALQHGAVLWAGVMILVAALGKPVALVCGLAILAAGSAPLRRRLAGAALPLVALPATVLLDALLEGRPLLAALGAPQLPDQHEAFVRVAQGRALGLGETLHLVLVEWFGGTLFARTWPLVAIGAALCVVALVRGTRRREVLPVLAVPILLVAAYLGLALVQPLVVFTRFFWPLAVAAATLAAFAAVTLAGRLPVGRPLQAALVAVFAAALLADRWDDHRWRERIMLRPFEVHAGIADEAVRTIAHDGRCAGSAVVPLAYLPLAAWRAPDKLARGELCAVEDWAEGRGCRDPRCVLFIPDAPTTASAREAVGRLVDDGYVVEVGNGSGALVRSTRG